MNIEQIKIAIKAADNMDELAALLPEIGDNEELLAMIEDQMGLLDDLEQSTLAAMEVPDTSEEEHATDDSEGNVASSEAEGAEVEGAYEPSARKVAAVKAAVAAATAISTNLDQPLIMAGYPHTKYKVGKDGDIIITGLQNTIQNLEHMLAGYGITCRYNEMTRLREIQFPGLVCSEDNKDEVTVNEILNLTVINGMAFSADRLSGALSSICERDCYHPAREWIDSKEWDGVSRFEALADTLAVTSEEYARHRNAMLRRWLISAVAALFSENPADKFELALTFQGAQGKGKTTWFKRLAEPSLGAVLDGVRLNPHDKDCVFTFAGHWIAELGELDSTFSKAEVGAIKAFMSKSFDMLRRPYARFDSKMKRRGVLGATVNRPDFFIDETGNRRWLTIPVIGVDHQHEIDMQQLWAEVKTWYVAGEQWWLNDAESMKLAEINQRFEAVLPVAEMLFDAFIAEGSDDAADLFGELDEEERKTVRITATQVCVLFNLPKDRKNAGEAGAALRKLTGKEATSYGGNRVWQVTPNPRSSYAATVRALLGYAK